MMGERGKPKIRSGVITSDKMDKTVAVSVTRIYQHPFYGKTVRSSSKVLAHDENNDCQLGDTVQITESRPLSRHKRWRVQKILAKAD
ncbi:30S ribosomal protein S17 [Candidatus Poribacteria bacterium]|jgi:small subunit ribosomal protein S17|nr:30S ribosomal protein S17 [Candidatus Poribacteria bacterium]MDP6748827.1 30S ribosomal protein S17 [Candidatus Poribacteria bacterium]MDP6961215.1 30S ribosomal protein S17 [Dehalococcoidia bacterium]